MAQTMHEVKEGVIIDLSTIRRVTTGTEGGRTLYFKGAGKEITAVDFPSGEAKWAAYERIKEVLIKPE